MNQNFFYWDHIKNYTAVFGNLISNISIERSPSEIIKVPIAYGPKEKTLARLQTRLKNVENDTPAFSDNIAITLPRLAFELKSIRYDPSRKFNKRYEFLRPNNISDIEESGIDDYTNNIARSSYTPVPYNFHYEMYLMTKTETDGSLVLDQIIPRFNPQINVPVRIQPTSTVAYDPLLEDYINSFRNQLGLVYDTPVILKETHVYDTYENDYEERRSLNWKFDFVLQGVLFGPTDRKRIVKVPTINYGVQDNPSYAQTLTPSTATKNWAEISIDDKDDVTWEESLTWLE